jgi:pyruvate dehydrogenase E2 component (dihydrolipoamide acetyltransferase)
MSDTMTEGVIADWHKKVGDTVKSGDLLAEVETDKATMELESYVGGTLLYIGVEKGGKVPVNQLLAIIGDASKIDVAAIVAASKSLANRETSAVSIASESTLTPVAATTTVNATTENGKAKASPLARKLAVEKGINILSINGTGDGGRIVKRDIDSYVPNNNANTIVASPTTTTTAPAFVAGAGEGYTDTVNSQMRKTIARRLSESKFSAPHFYLKMEVNMDNAIAARKAMNEISTVKISFQDMMIKACAMALRLHPAVNSSWMGDFIRTYNHIHVGSAVAVEEGLIVPVFKFADQKSLSQIATEANDLYTKAKTKKLQPQEFTGNTFTISNLGMMDIDEFTAIVNPPDSAILAVGKIKEVVIKKGEGFGVANMLMLTLSCDHRIVDGAVGARFLQSLKAFLQNPVTMLV